ncbi:MAG: hypothetical protein IH968_07310 [Gemmatimonadetes bacterium]|nr:hypothetical protein [Gemmatimonadota bacterium]
MKTSNRVRIFRRAGLLPLLAVPILFASTGCASGGFGGRSDLNRSQPKGVTAHIENQNWSDMKVYLLIDGLRMWRLATLSTLETRTLRIPPHLLQGVQDFQLEATAIGSGDTVTTPKINAVAGDEIVWTVQNYLASSINTLFIR